MFNKRDKILKKFKKEIRSGIYAYIVLSILEKRELHGYAIRKIFESLSYGKLVPSEGTLYDLLKTLQKLGLVKSFWVEECERLRKCYRITDLGKEILEELRHELKLLSKVIERLEVRK
jgi:DNA-binding PadR family transcriptional regulator